MLAALIGAGVWGQTHIGLLDDEVHRQVGHSPQLLFDGHVLHARAPPLIESRTWTIRCELLR